MNSKHKDNTIEILQTVQSHIRQTKKFVVSNWYCFCHRTVIFRIPKMSQRRYSVLAVELLHSVLIVLCLTTSRTYIRALEQLFGRPFLARAHYVLANISCSWEDDFKFYWKSLRSMHFWIHRPLSELVQTFKKLMQRCAGGKLIRSHSRYSFVSLQLRNLVVRRPHRYPFVVEIKILGYFAAKKVPQTSVLFEKIFHHGSSTTSVKCTLSTVILSSRFVFSCTLSTHRQIHVDTQQVRSQTAFFSESEINSDRDLQISIRTYVIH